MQPTPPCLAPSCWWQTRASGLLLCWELQFGRWPAGFIYLFFPPSLCCSLRFPNPPQTSRWEGFLVLGNFSSFMTPSPGRVSVPNSFVSSFYLLSFALPPFKDNGLPLWVPGILRQRSEVVLWYLLSLQMIFWWICGGENGLPVLLLCHLLETLNSFYIKQN